MQKAWISVILAATFEVVWAISMKKNAGWSHLLWSLCSVFMLIPILLLISSAAKTLPIGTAYAVFTALGTLGTVLIGILFFKEALTWQKCFCLTLLLIGVVGLKLTE